MKPLTISKINSFTDRSNVTVDKYLQEISKSKYDVITPEMESELAFKIQNGDRKALEKLIHANVRFVVSVAKQYDQFNDIKLMDLINEGNIGLIKAAHKFDATRGFKFISMAVWWIRQSILEFINENVRLMRLPYNKAQALNHISKIEQTLMQELGRKPTNSELEEAFCKKGLDSKYSIKNFKNYETIDKKPVSLDKDISKTGEDFTLLDKISSDNHKEAESLSSIKTDINRYLHTLHHRQKEVLERYFGLNDHKEQSLFEISKLVHINMTSERIRQIKNKGIDIIRMKLKEDDLLSKYLG